MITRREFLRYGVAVAAVRQSDRDVEITIRRPEGTETLRADRAVCTLRCPAIGRILDEGAALAGEAARDPRAALFTHGEGVPAVADALLAEGRLERLRRI